MKAADAGGGGVKRPAQFIAQAGQRRIDLGLRHGKIGHAVSCQAVKPRCQLQQGRITARSHIGKDIRNRGRDIDSRLALRCQKCGERTLEIILPIVESDSHC